MPTGPARAAEEAISDRAGVLWVDIVGPDEPENRKLEDWLSGHFHFHPLALEDALKETHIAKVDDWDEYLYIVFHVVSVKPGTSTLELDELDIFLGPNYLMTYHTGPMPILDRDRASIEREPRDRLRHGADHLLYRFLELATDQSLEAIEFLDDQVDEIQNAVIENPHPGFSRRSSVSSGRRSDSTSRSHRNVRCSTTWHAILISRFSPSTAFTFVTSTTMWCEFTTSPRVCAT